MAREEAQGQGLAVEPLFTDRLKVVARAGHPIFDRGMTRLADLQFERWILPWTNSLSRTLLEAAFRQGGPEPPVAAVESADDGERRLGPHASPPSKSSSIRPHAFSACAGSWRAESGGTQPWSAG